MKILVSCYACSPYQGSEPGMGWNFVNCLSRYHELHIITEGKFEADIRRFFCENPERKEDFHFYFIWKKRHKKLRKIWPPSYYWFYKAWQKKAYKLALQLNERENFDVIHQLNMVGYREPGYLWEIKKPLVWGPIGGFDTSPWSMLFSMGIKGTIFYGCRNLINIWQMYTKLRVRFAMKKASSLIAATATVRNAIQSLYGRDSIIIPEVGLDKKADMQFARRETGELLRICWSGQHTPGKALNLLLEAIATINRKDIELHILGYGTETNKWKKLASKLKLQNIVWHGWIDKGIALELMRSCHLFCITSLKDLTSSVLLEALSYGLPVIALDHCGFSNVLNDSCGYKIPIQNKQQVVNELGLVICKFAEDENYRRNLASGALARAEEYNWIDKAKTINKIYESVSVQNI